MISKNKIINLLKYSKTYPFNDRENGYHTIKIGDEVFKGQRDCVNRFNTIMHELKNKNVIDFGCCTGGMLHALFKDIIYGIGFVPELWSFEPVLPYWVPLRSSSIKIF